jgi:xylitol oxidase
MERLQRVSSALTKPSTSPDGHLQNWAKSLTYSTSNVYYPKNVEDVQEIVKKCAKLRIIGSRHSFSKIADSTEALICLDFLNKLVSLDKVNHTVTVEGGMKYGNLCEYLHENGYALNNLASLPHISIAGSIATATHGSGVSNYSLTSSVVSFELVKADGEVIVISRKDGELFKATVVGLGGFGVVTKVTLELEPTYEIQQDVYTKLPMAALEKNFMEIASGAYSVSLFTNWQNKTINEVWFKAKVPKNGPKKYAPELYGAKLATKKMHPVETQDAEPCTDQLGIPGPWYDRLPHFRMKFNPSTGKELQTEFFIPIEKAYEAIMAIESLNEKISPYVLITEVRMIKGDTDWMSPTYKRDSIGIHFTWKQEWETVQKLIPQVEAVLEPLDPRPHWAKLFSMSPSKLQSKYEKIDEFRALLKKFDPTGKFRNEFMNTYIFGN